MNAPTLSGFPKTNRCFNLVMTLFALIFTLGGCGGGGGGGGGSAAPDTTASSTQIAAARASADGSGLSLPITGALVTYTKPTIGADVAGFFIQGSQTGPALFVAVDPQTLSPVPVAGDHVDLTITAMGTSGQLRQATAVTGYTRRSQGNSLTGLRQDVTAATDLVSNIGGYEGELISLLGTLTSNESSSGTGFVGFGINTSGIADNVGLRLRIPSSVQLLAGLNTGCTVTLTGTPMWQYNGVAQPSAWTLSELAGTTCSAPQVQSVLTTSATNVRVIFNRPIDQSTVLADGSQFSVNGLAVSAASSNGNYVDLSTSSMTNGQNYSVTIANTVRDVFGTGVDQSANSGNFTYVVLALVSINELNANITNGCDLVELRVLQGGSMDGYQLWERNGSILTFTGLTVADADIIVVHIDGSDALCNPGASANETSAKNQYANATYTANYDTAYDWYSADTGITSTDNVITLYNSTGTIIDAVFLTSGESNLTAAAGTELQAATVAAAGEWEMVGGGIPAGGFIDTDFNNNAVVGLISTGTVSTGTSIQCNTSVDSNTETDWTVTASSWGAINAGQ